MRETSRWLRLRAGVPVVRRDDTHLQVGSHPEARLVVGATDACSDLLRRLVHGLDPSLLGAGDAAVVAALAASGLLVAPDERATRLRRRSATRVEVLGPDDWRADLCARLSEVGVGTVDPAHDADDLADVAVVLTAGEPDRGLADRCLRTDQPTLFVAAIDGRVRLGPWVVPGSTACLQCLDAHARERDPRHLVMVEQWGAADAAAEVEVALVSLALAWACADVVRWCHAQRPTTWSSTVWLDEAALPTATAWSRHPWCGCGWAGLDVTG